MMCTARILGSLAAVSLLVNAASGATADNPYERIIARNLFGLKDPPPPAPPVIDKPPTPAITLQGFTTILGKNQVLFKVALPAKPPQPASEVSKILAEGDREDEISVLEINLVDRSVKFDNHGTLEVKNIKDHAAKPAGTPVNLAGGVPQPGAAQPAIGGGTVTPPPAFAANTATPGGSAGLSSRANTMQSIPPRQTRANANTTTTTTPYGVVTTQNPTPQPGQNWPPERSMTPEEQEILIEVERERNKNNPNYPPLPPTSITPNPTPTQPRSQ